MLGKLCLCPWLYHLFKGNTFSFQVLSIEELSDLAPLFTPSNRGLLAVALFSLPSPVVHALSTLVYFLHELFPSCMGFVDL